jgi:hypothetical protein
MVESQRRLATGGSIMLSLRHPALWIAGLAYILMVFATSTEPKCKPGCLHYLMQRVPRRARILDVHPQRGVIFLCDGSVWQLCRNGVLKAVGEDE